MPIANVTRSGALSDPDALTNLRSNNNSSNVSASKEPGETVDKALNIRVFDDGKRTYTDEVGGSDDLDLYKFSTSRTNDFNFFLTDFGTDADLDLRLLDGNGELLAVSNSTGDAEILTGDLSAGTYFLGVVPYNRVDSNYELSIYSGDNALSSAEIMRLGFPSVLVTEFSEI